MESDSDRRRQVEDLISSLGEHMKVTQSARLDLATQLLAMARLELQLALHDIPQSELDVFCAAIEHPVRGEKSAPAAQQAAEADTRAETNKIQVLRESLVVDGTRVTRQRRG